MKVEGPVESIFVPPQSARAVKVKAGSLIAIVDVEGRQVGDMFAFSQADPTEYLSAAYTRQLYRKLFPAIGEPFATNRLRPILTMVSDTSPGMHDMLLATCSPATYKVKYGIKEWHPSCEENFFNAVRDLGYEFDHIPDPVNIFQDSAVKSGSTEIVLKPAQTVAGDRVVFRAEMDLVFVLTACASDTAPTNAGKCKPLLIEISG